MFRFTIRELVLVTVIVALALGWWVDHWRLRRLGSVWETVARTLYARP